MRKAHRPEAEMKLIRAAEQQAGKPLVAHGSCKFCDWTIGKGQLWCSADCANEYASEKAASTPQNVA